VSAAFNADVMTGQQAITITTGQDTTQVEQTYDQTSTTAATDMRRSRPLSRITQSARDSAAKSKWDWRRRGS